MDVKYDGEDLTLMSLRSLPPSYNHFRDSLILNKETLSVEEVKEAFFAKELMDNEFVHSTYQNPADRVLACRGASGKDSGSSFMHKNLTYNYCKKKGHIKADCFKLKNKQQYKEESDETNFIEDESGGEFL